jgi:hypothetical protein
MFSFLISTLFVAALLFLGIAIYKAFAQVAAHVRRHPEAGKAIFDHVFMPLFEERKAPNASEPKANPD